jgi:hypothetical protein
VLVLFLFIAGYSIWLLYRYSKGQYSTKSYFQHSCLVIVSSLHSNVPDRFGLKCFSEVHFSHTTIPRIWLFHKKWLWSVFFTDLNWLFVKAHYESGYEEGKAKSNSLLYIYNADTDKDKATYDVNLDP